MTSKGSAFVWPDVSTIEGARKAGLQGTWAALFIAIATAIVASVNAAGVQLFPGQASFIDAALFAVIAFAISRMSRVAAVVALVFYIAETLYSWSTTEGRHAVVMNVILTLAFITSVRGTFAYHSLQGQAPPASPTARRTAVRTPVAQSSYVWGVVTAIAVVVVGIAAYFGFMIKFQHESKGTGQLSQLKPIEVPAEPQQQQAAIVAPTPRPIARAARAPDPNVERQRKQEIEARLAAEPQIYLEKPWKMYHVAGCRSVTAEMERVPIEKKPIEYTPHTCVPDEIRTWTRKLTVR